VVGVLAFAATTGSAAKPQTTVNATSSAPTPAATTCSGLLTVTFNVAGKGGVTKTVFQPDLADTATFTGLGAGGVIYAKPSKGDTVTVFYQMTSGTGQIDVTPRQRSELHQARNRT
jgi:hypothetical protein